MDSVLVESMSYHYQAMKTAIKEVANIDLDKRTFYLLEGMPIAEMALEILKIKGYVDVKNITNTDIQISENIAKRKKELFKQLSKVSKFMSSFFITLSRFRDSYCSRTRY
jgi:beta-phosphoglucomutase-like phosphatase (HAD superfamily)